MSGGWPQLVWLVFLLAAVGWLVSVLAVRPVVGGMIGEVRDRAARSRRVLLAAWVPWLVPTALVAAVMATAGSKAVGWIADHCPHHGLGHPHLCFLHLPAIDLGLLHGAFVAIVVGVIAASALRLMRAACTTNRRVRSLKALAASRGPLQIISTRTPFALAGGVLEPVVLLSRGLLEQLSPRERRIVVAHEAAHVRHGDGLRNVLFEVLLLIHLPWARRCLRAQWLRAMEERADDAVARRFTAEDVVQTLLHVARLELRQPAPGFSVAGADLPGRARRLLDDAGGPAGAFPAFEIVYALVLVALFAAAVSGHHALETLLGLIAGH